MLSATGHRGHRHKYSSRVLVLVLGTLQSPFFWKPQYLHDQMKSPTSSGLGLVEDVTLNFALLPEPVGVVTATPPVFGPVGTLAVIFVTEANKTYE